jgi:hypothetical protein
MLCWGEHQAKSRQENYFLRPSFVSNGIHVTVDCGLLLRIATIIDDCSLLCPLDYQMVAVCYSWHNWFLYISYLLHGQASLSLTEFIALDYYSLYWSILRAAAWMGKPRCHRLTVTWNDDREIIGFLHFLCLSLTWVYCSRLLQPILKHSKGRGLNGQASLSSIDSYTEWRLQHNWFLCLLWAAWTSLSVID